MYASGATVKRARGVAMAVISFALLVTGCDGTLNGGGPKKDPPNLAGSLDSAIDAESIEKDSEASAEADSGVAVTGRADASPVDPCGSCGNGTVNCGEACDDGNQVVERCADPRPERARVLFVKVCGVNCRWTMCRAPRCGDDIVDRAAGEECDEGKATRTCLRSCELTTCGQQADLRSFVDDHDCDGFVDDQDNCPETHNPDQADADEDGMGDPCDPWECTGPSCGAPARGCGCGGASITISNTDLGRTFYSEDFDSDGWEDDFDNCQFDFNPSQADGDGDGVGDVCDPEVCPIVCR